MASLQPTSKGAYDPVDLIVEDPGRFFTPTKQDSGLAAKQYHMKSEFSVILGVQ